MAADHRQQHMMALRAELYGRSEYEGVTLPKVAEVRTYAELIGLTAAPREVLVLIRAGDKWHLIRATRSDEPGLEVLSPSDRALVASAVHSLHRDSREGTDG